MSSSSSSKVACFLSLKIFILFLQTTNAADPLRRSCSNRSLTTGSPYELNLNRLTSFLYFHTPSTGYAQASFGLDPDRTFGLGLCRGDISSLDCWGCITQAGSQIRKLCPRYKEATIWYDHCMFKYSDQDFFGRIDNRVTFFLWDTKNVSDPTLFNQKNAELMGRLSEEASANPKRYASGEIEVDGEMRIYGMVQCTRDLSSYDCEKCIESEIMQFPTCCEGKQGGRVIGGSCNVRYEMYPFLKM